MTKEKGIPQIRFSGFTDTWEQRKFSELTEIRSASRVHKEEWQSSGVPFYRSSDVMAALNGTENEKAFISEELYEKLSAVSGKLEKGDILVTGGGSVGKPYIVPNNEPLYTKDADLLWVKNNEKLVPYFIYTFFFSPAFSDYLNSVSHVGTIAHYTITQLEETPITLPCVSEQQKIGDYFRNIDTLITLHQRKYDKLTKVKKAMLEKMFPKNGSLYPEIRFKGFTDAWEQREVSNVAMISTGGTPSTAINEYWNPKQVPWLSSGEVHKKYITYTDDKISNEGLNHSSARMIKQNSVLIALAGQGKTRGTVAINRISLSTNQSIAAMTFAPDICPEFVFSNLESRYDELRKVSSGDGTRGGLNKQLVSEIQIPYTSLNEQRKIGQFFTHLDRLITLHQRKLEKLKNIKKACLEKMFV